MHFAFSKQWGKIDYRVWMSLIILSLISFALLGYKLATNVDCPALKLSVISNLNHAGLDSNTFFVNEQVTFNVNTAAPDSYIAWDFGDKTASHIGTKISHTYTKEGNYLVTVTVKGKCAESMIVRVVQNSISVFDNSALTINPIVSADIVKAGDETTFNTSAVAKTYTWSVEELPDLGKVNTGTAKFIFTKPGTFTVTLLLDNGSVYKKVIQVIDPLAQTGKTVALPPITPMGAPPLTPPADEPLPLPEKNKTETTDADKNANAPPVKTFDQLPTPAIQALLEGVTRGEKSAEDFNNILCNGAGTKVMANDESITFAELMNELKEKKGLPFLKRKRKIKSVKVVRDEAAGNCVKILYIDFK